MDMYIDPAGTIRCIYDEAVELAAIGTMQIQRVSHVDPDDNGQWWADLSPIVGGKTGAKLGPFGTRSEALAAEAAFLREHLLADGGKIGREPSAEEFVKRGGRLDLACPAPGDELRDVHAPVA